MKTVSVGNYLGFEKVRFNKNVKNYLLLKLKGKEIDVDKERPPISIIALLDVSSSMSSEKKIGYLKKSMIKLIDNLRSSDSLCMIQYNSSAKKIFNLSNMNSENKRKAIDIVNSLSASGCTNMSGAMNLAYDELRENKSRLSKEGMVIRTILFTDGCPTAGNTNKDYLVEMCKDVPIGQITTMGYGNSEFSHDLDIDLLQNMSKMGCGNSYYMKDPDTCTRSFAYELAGLLTTVGQNIRIEVQPTKHMDIKEVMDDCDCEERDGNVIINIPDIISEEERYLMIEFETKQQDKVFPRLTKIGNVIVEYYNLEGQKVSDEYNIKLNFVKEGEEDKHINNDVSAHLAILESIKFNKLAFDKAQHGDYNKANEILDKVIVILTSVDHPRTIAEAERQKRINTLYVDKETYSKSINSLSSVNYSNTFGGSRSQADPFLSASTLASQSAMYYNFTDGSTSADNGSTGTPVVDGASDNCVPVMINDNMYIWDPDAHKEKDWEEIVKTKDKEENKIIKKSDTVRF